MKKSEIKILKFETKPKELLSTEEIMKVFSGLIRLIQKSAEFKANEKMKTQIELCNKRFDEAKTELNKRTYQVNELLKLNEELIRQLAEESKGKSL